MLFSALVLSGCSATITVDDEKDAPAEEEAVEETAPVAEVFDVIVAKAALQAKHPDWALADMAVTVDESDESFATGTVGDGPGGGMYFAANTDDGWVIAWDGNGSVDCADIEAYDFPTEMLPECWDYETGTLMEM